MASSEPPSSSRGGREEPLVRRSADPDELAERTSAHLISRLARLQDSGRVPSVVLTGGSIAVKIHEAVAGSPDRDLVDWGHVDFWFGDERFVPADSPDRNAGQAFSAMLGSLPVDPSRVHVMAASGGEYGDDVDAAAAAYAEDLRRADRDDAAALFDVLMLGIGPDGHCASLFPGRHEMDDGRAAVAVRNSPKPPPTRITLTMRTLGQAHDVWFVAAGSDKAQAVSDAASGADPVRVPAAGPRGRSRTLWMLDEAAAAQLR